MNELKWKIIRVIKKNSRWFDFVYDYYVLGWVIVDLEKYWNYILIINMNIIFNKWSLFLRDLSGYVVFIGCCFMLNEFF